MTPKELAARLREEAERLTGSSLNNGCAGCGIAANTAEEAADYLDRLSAPPADVGLTRYGLAPLDDGEVRMQIWNNGEWVRYEDHAAAFARVKTAGRALISIGAEAAVEAADSAEGWKERAEEAKAALAAARAVMVDEDDYPVVGRLREVVARSATGPRLPLVVVEELSNIASEFHRALSAEVAARKDAETALAASEAKRKDAEERAKAFERAGWTVTGWREKDRPEWFCRATAQLIADQYREARNAALDQPKTEDAA